MNMVAITLSGWDEFKAKLNGMAAILEKEIDGEMYAAALDWELRAKQSAPVNFGFLRNAISTRKLAPMVYEVVSGAAYTPYQEWGTGTRVKVPSNLQAYAIQFKGKKKTVGIYPHPFFFIHMPVVLKSMMTNIQNNVLNKEH